MKVPVTPSACSAFAVYIASIPVPKSPASYPPNPARTETVSVSPLGGSAPQITVQAWGPPVRASLEKRDKDFSLFSAFRLS